MGKDSIKSDLKDLVSSKKSLESLDKKTDFVNSFIETYKREYGFELKECSKVSNSFLLVFWWDLWD